MNICLIKQAEISNTFYKCPRGSQLLREGLKDHLVTTWSKADYFLLDYMYGNNKQKEFFQYVDHHFDKRLIVVDWSDSHNQFLVPNIMDNRSFYRYFKRSWLVPNPDHTKIDNAILMNKKDILPISYGILDCYPCINKKFSERVIDIGCYLRNQCYNRTKVGLFIQNLVEKIKCKSRVGPVSRGNTSQAGEVFIDETYFNCLGQTKLLVTCNPTKWHGDFRTYEALATGCLVFSDERPLCPFPLLHKQHIVYYDPNNLDGLKQDLLFYLENQKKAEEIAMAGQEFALTHHTSKVRCNYILESL